MPGYVPLLDDVTLSMSDCTMSPEPQKSYGDDEPDSACEPYIDRIVRLHSTPGEDDEEYVYEEDSEGGVSEDDESLEYDSDESTVLLMHETDDEAATAERDVGAVPMEDSGRTPSLRDGDVEALSWRMEPVRSFSDWTIKIKTGGSESVDTYHVHRNILAVGERKSGYFETVFRGKSFREAATNKSSIDLNERLAEHFPLFLDFIYSSSGFKLTTANALELRSLAQYFVAPKLQRSVNEFIKNDMSGLENLEHYYVELSHCDDEDARELVAHASRTCVQRICDIQKSSSLLFALAPVFFLHVVSALRDSRKNCMRLDVDGRWKHLGVLIASYVLHHRDILTEDYFWALTGPNWIRLFFQNSDAALDLLELIKDTNWPGLVNVQSDCVHALSLRYLGGESEPTEEIFQKLSKSAIVALLRVAFRKARAH